MASNVQNLADDAAEPPLVSTTVVDRVATVRIQHGKVNALSSAVLIAVAEAFEALDAEGVGAAILTGGDRLFAAGADLSEFAEMVDGVAVVAEPDRVGEISDNFARAARAIENAPFPTIASISGYALGGGCELALACDLRFGSERAVLGQPEILLGIIPGGGGTQRLARLVGAARALDLVITGRQVDATEAMLIGLLQRVVPADQLDATVAEYAQALAIGPRRAIRLAKAALRRGLEGTLDEGIAIERSAFVEVFSTEDAATGIASFNANGPGKAIFTGR